MEFGFQNGVKMEPKIHQTLMISGPRETQVVHLVQTLDFGSPWASFGLPFGSLWLPLGCLLAPFGTLWLPLGSLGAVCGPPKDLIASGGEISPRSCRDSAENVPRTLQEPAENPPYEPQAKLPFTVRLLRKDAVRRQTLRQNRLE